MADHFLHMSTTCSNSHSACNANNIKKAQHLHSLGPWRQSAAVLVMASNLLLLLLLLLWLLHKQARRMTRLPACWVWR